MQRVWWFLELLQLNVTFSFRFPGANKERKSTFVRCLLSARHWQWTLLLLTALFMAKWADPCSIYLFTYSFTHSSCSQTFKIRLGPNRQKVQVKGTAPCVLYEMAPPWSTGLGTRSMVPHAVPINGPGLQRIGKGEWLCNKWYWEQRIGRKKLDRASWWL